MSRSGGIFDYAEKKEQLEEVIRELEEPSVWNDRERALQLGKDQTALEEIVLTVDRLAEGLVDSQELLEMSEADNDEAAVNDVIEEIDGFERDLAKLEFKRMFSGEMDSCNAFLEVQSGSGGTEAQDWCEMVLRMFLRWGEAKGFGVELMEASPGDVAGIKSATIKFEGDHAYGWARTETGVHRLVRKSPFDSGGRRHTSFCSVFVSPEIDDDIEIDIDPSDLRIDVYRASGAGGQHVNKTESAIRITHLPTGIVSESQDGRSQHKNKEIAMAQLYQRIKHAQDTAAQNEMASARKSLVGSGDRSEKIRTYNYPQNRVTDHRINLTLHSLDKIVAGALDPVIEGLQVAENATKLKEGGI